MMPGAFPNDTTGPSRRQELGSQGLGSLWQINHQNIGSGVPYATSADLVELQLLQSFENKHKSITNILLQSHLVSQLDTLVYILIGYQTVKYCHSASLLPAIGHILIQQLLSCSAITSRQSGGFIQLVAQYYRERENDRHNNDLEINNSTGAVIPNDIAIICSAIYCKTILVILYHCLFMSFWLIPIVDAGGLKMISNGTWWFVSFIGEYRPIDRWSDLSHIQKVTKLGLWELIGSDLVILFIQLVLFQSIYRQSTILSNQDGENRDETEILRRQGEAVESRGGDVVLRVRLYEAFRSNSFILTSSS